MRKTTIYSKLAEQLSEIAKEHGILHSWYRPPFRIIRTRVGYYQRAAGAWLFYLADSEGHEIFGSCNGAREVLKAHKGNRLSYLVEYGSHTFIVESGPTSLALK